MQTFKKVLLASHGTPGAQPAEQAALNLCASGGTLFHIYIVPDFWKGMMGDDWLNNDVTRNRFAKYLEGTLEKEMQVHLQRVANASKAAGVEYRSIVAVGRPTSCIANAQREHGAELIVIGSRRPKGTLGLQSAVDLNKLGRAIHVPLMVTPYPNGHAR